MRVALFVSAKFGFSNSFAAYCDRNSKWRQRNIVLIFAGSFRRSFRRLAFIGRCAVSRYDAGTELVYNVTGLEKSDTARVHLLVERFIGGGFAGQVYRVKILDIQNAWHGFQPVKTRPGWPCHR